MSAAIWKLCPSGLYVIDKDSPKKSLQLHTAMVLSCSFQVILKYAVFVTREIVNATYDALYVAAFRF